MRTDDGDPFNAGFNAALNEVLKLVKKLPTVKVADDGIHALISKAAVLEAIRNCD